MRSGRGHCRLASKGCRRTGDKTYVNEYADCGASEYLTPLFSAGMWRSPDPPPDSARQRQRGRRGQHGAARGPAAGRLALAGAERRQQERVRLGLERPRGVRPTLAAAVAQLPDLGDVGGGDRGGPSTTVAISPSPVIPRVPRKSRPTNLALSDSAAPVAPRRSADFTLSPPSPARPAVPRRSLPPDLKLNGATRPSDTRAAPSSVTSAPKTSSLEWQEITGNRPTIEQETKEAIAKATHVSWEGQESRDGDSTSSSRRRDSILDASGALSSTALPHTTARTHDRAATDVIPEQPRTTLSSQPYRPKSKWHCQQKRPVAK